MSYRPAFFCFGILLALMMVAGTVHSQSIQVVAVSPQSQTAGQPVTFTNTCSSGQCTSGILDIFSCGTSACPALEPSAGSCGADWTSGTPCYLYEGACTSTGSVNIGASTPGATLHIAGYCATGGPTYMGTNTLTVLPSSSGTETLLVSPTSTTAGQQVTFTSTCTGGCANSGLVINDCGTGACPSTPAGGGCSGTDWTQSVPCDFYEGKCSASTTVTIPSGTQGGTLNFEAYCTSGSGYLPGTNTLSVTALPTTETLAVSPQSVPAGQSLTLTAKCAGGACTNSFGAFIISCGTSACPNPSGSYNNCGADWTSSTPCQISGSGGCTSTQTVTVGSSTPVGATVNIEATCESGTSEYQGTNSITIIKQVPTISGSPTSVTADQNIAFSLGGASGDSADLYVLSCAAGPTNYQPPSGCTSTKVASGITLPNSNYNYVIQSCPTPNNGGYAWFGVQDSTSGQWGNYWGFKCNPEIISINPLVVGNGGTVSVTQICSGSVCPTGSGSSGYIVDAGLSGSTCPSNPSTLPSCGSPDTDWTSGTPCYLSAGSPSGQAIPFTAQVPSLPKSVVLCAYSGKNVYGNWFNSTPGLLTISGGSGSLAVTIDGTSGETVNSNTLHTVQVTGGTQGALVSILYCPDNNGQANCAGATQCGDSDCGGTFDSTGTFPTTPQQDHCLYNSGSQDFKFWISCTSTVSGITNTCTPIAVTIHPGLPCSSSSGSSGGLPPGVTGAICSIYFAVNTIVFILALTLMILGGALYAGSQILPGQSRGVVQGYAFGLIFGGIAGAVIAVFAPFILSIVYNSPANIISAACA